MRRSVIRSTTLAFLVFAIVFLVAARAQKPQPSSPMLTDREKAIEVVRVINAAEYDYRTEHGRFASWREVYASGAVTNLLQTWPKIKDLSISPADEVIPGFRLTLLVAEEGAAYSVALREMKTDQCGLSVFTDQAGLIYEGKIVDCPQIADHPGEQ
jgi:hypothetical protein